MKKITISIGDKTVNIFGGSFLNAPTGKDWCLVKMAKEIDRPCDISIPTVDFSTPDKDSLLDGMKLAYIALFKGKKLYVGCMGGVGRTGLFLASMAKVSLYLGDAFFWENGLLPVAYVKSQYSPHAVETVDQQILVDDLDVTEVVTLGECLQDYKLLKYMPKSFILWVAKLNK